MTYDAILLTSFGGPEGPDEVMPYLERVTAGRGVPRERLEEVSHHYLALGGVSPINEQNRALLAAMKERFPERGIDIPIYWGNRNSAPFFADVVKEMYDNGHRRVLAWVTSAYSSYSGCRQYRENLYQALADNDLVGKMVIDKVRHYFDHPGFLQPVIEDLEDKLQAMVKNGLDFSEIDVMFATHSIPDAMGETSGPPALRETFEKPGGAYAAQHLAAAEIVMDKVHSDLGVSPVSWQLVYQSRSGSPQVPWLEPDVNDAIRDAHKSGKKGVIVVPIGFVSDHVEVIWDLDNEAQETASELGLEFARVTTPGSSLAFTDGIADLILERINEATPQALSPLGPWPSQCAVGCCPNLRRELKVIAEASAE
ncbi:ferrochelatase [Aurantimicrobium sp. MWH-Uga1]|uniref:ferrochelatase n=1 Tax=Aurantimicrobium sp. MWH-Uga1 TaxID=2079575 RepID=UPI000DED5E93|nr:ferrochelatase [Aurantimicrobium sp. MWH-Uga1]AXE53826.1 Ferrochelatase [Aurantimicrobium sp. MWH-Uga1]